MIQWQTGRSYGFPSTQINESSMHFAKSKEPDTKSVYCVTLFLQHSAKGNNVRTETASQEIGDRGWETREHVTTEGNF